LKNILSNNSILDINGNGVNLNLLNGNITNVLISTNDIRSSYGHGISLNSTYSSLTNVLILENNISGEIHGILFSSFNGIFNNTKIYSNNILAGNTGIYGEIDGYIGFTNVSYNSIVGNVYCLNFSKSDEITLLILLVG
jgi:hypothetical protein